MISEAKAKTETTKGKGRKILTLKQMIQRLPVVLPQVIIQKIIK